ncbi:MAG: hypothetical protein GX781_02670 [Clostridiales bacterium]|nr:hypothetical protein [Clostridiales bacterium]
MTDYILTAGRGTTVREDTEALTAHVDLSTTNLADLSPNVAEKNDTIFLQKGGASSPVKATLAELQRVIGGNVGTLWFGAESFALPADPNLSPQLEDWTRTEGTNPNILKILTFKGAADGNVYNQRAGINFPLPTNWDKGMIKIRVYLTCKAAEET